MRQGAILTDQSTLGLIGIYFQIECFIAEGSEEAPVEIQSVLPDLAGFSLVGSEVKNGEECDRWVKKEVIGDKMNKYQMWVKTVMVPEKPGMGMAVPIHYEMKGYNSLLGSHYDHYYLSYEVRIQPCRGNIRTSPLLTVVMSPQNFSPDSPKASVFDEYKKKGPCHGMPGPGQELRVSPSPVRRFQCQISTFRRRQSRVRDEPDARVCEPPL